MKKRISSSLTILYKFIYPGLWVLLLGVMTIHATIDNGLEGLSILVTLIFGLVLLYFLGIRAKKVDMDDRFLYISNFREEIKVPLRAIDRVSERILISPRMIFIHFNHETRFGRQIMFLGQYKPFLFFASHPIVIDIKRRLKSGQSSKGPQKQRK